MSRKNLLLGLYALNIAVIFFFWLQGSSILLASGDPSAILLAVARFAGLAAALCVLTQLLLIGRIKWIERVWGHEKLARYHRKNGRYILYLIITHATLILTSYSMTAQVSLVQQVKDFIEFYPDVLNALVAFVLFVTIAITSIYTKRLRLKYEMWYFIHLATYLAILFAFGHQQELGGTFVEINASTYWSGAYLFVIGNFVYFRVLSPVISFLRHGFYISQVESTTGNATSIYISGRNMDTLTREAGQFFIFRFLDRKRFWQAHPFSLSWGSAHPDIRISVKDSGDFTHEISGVKRGTRVYIDGPHGKFTMSNTTANKVLYIAGGIGITPIRALLEDNVGIRDQVLLFSNKKRGEVPLLSEIQELSRKFKIPVHYFYSEENRATSTDFVGRIDSVSIKKLVPDVARREVFLCGPEAFMLAMKEALVSIGVPLKNIHFELFSFH